jgi:secreted PhoX family phosphatase
VTLTPSRRTVLPLADVPPAHARGKRSPVTCRLKCGDACAHPVPNQSDNDYFPDIATRALSRRGLLGAGAAGGLALYVAGPAAAKPGRPRRGGLAFEAIAGVPSTVDAVTVPDGYRWDALVRWGDPLFDGAPAFDVMNQSEAAQERQFGYNCDYLDLIPLDGERGTRAVLVANHEYTNENIMFPPTTDPAQIEADKRTAIAAHGMSVVSLKRSRPGRPWRLDPSRKLNRRITGMSEFLVDGPAAGHDLLKTKDDPTGTRILGTFNNCAGGTTPWGTVLSGEENFNQYFVANASDVNASDANGRYGISSTPAGRMWWTVEPRFDARTEDYKNEVNRHGWIVEIDPMDPDSTPVKHTALGRFKHEAATIRIAPSGHVVAYAGDDERFDYVYKFVSRGRYDASGTAAARRRNMTLLSDGDLYVAKFTGDSPAAEITGTGALPGDGEFDGSGIWIPLVKDGRSMVPDMTVAQVLVFTRLAGDTVGATKMDRPEDVEANPKTGVVYVALTNNSQRGVPGSGRRAPVDEANPKTANRDGYVLELVEAANDPTRTTFAWKLLLVCGPANTAGTYFGGYDGPVSPNSCPDNIAFDSVGNLWISTDGQPGTIQLDDALHKVTLSGPERGKVEQFLAVPVDAETCGPVIHDRDGMVFICVQHPGEEGTWAAQRSYFPDYIEPGARRDGKWGGPRPSVVQVYRDVDGEDDGD